MYGNRTSSTPNITTTLSNNKQRTTTLCHQHCHQAIQITSEIIHGKWCCELMTMGFFGLGCFVFCTPTLQKAALTNMPPTLLQMAKNNEDDTSNSDRDSTIRYSPPKHSKEFLRHLESVKSSWPYNDDEDVADQAKDDVLSNSEYGVYCTGEPSIDPSRMLQGISEDDHDWM